MSAVVAAVVAVLVTTLVIRSPADDGPALTRTATAYPAKGTILSGEFGFYGGGSNQFFGGYVPFGTTLRYAIDEGRAALVYATSPTTDCPGRGKVRRTGFLCIYFTGTAGGSDFSVSSPLAPGTTSRRGFVMNRGNNSVYAYAVGSWSLKVGDASTAP